MPEFTVLDAFFRQLKSLRLSEYPVLGKNVKKDRRKPNIFDENEKEKEDEIVEMIDLIKDKKSPWFESYDWSKDCDLIRERFIKDRNSININKIEQYFTNLRLNSLDITQIDDLRSFTKLDELILSCNLISKCDLSNLPGSLKILDLSANLISNIHEINVKTKTNIQHLSLAYNSIETVDHFFNPKFWGDLVSLDLSSNNLYELANLIIELENLKNLKVLILSRNPVGLIPGYRGLVIDSLPNLFSLDDTPITKEERINFQDFKLYADILSEHAEIIYNFLQIKNLIFPEVPDFEDEPEIYLFKYFIRFESMEDFDFEESFTLKTESTQDFEPMTNLDLVENDKGRVNLNFKSVKKLRDFLIRGTRIELVEKKIYYQLKNYEPPSEEELKKKKKDAKKEERKDTKKKKKTIGSLLDNYNQVNVEEKVLADFKLELESVLDGYSKIIEKNFQTKQKVDFINLGFQTPTANKNNDSKKSKKDEKNSKKKATEPDLRETIEQPPLELLLKFQVLDFENFKSLKDYLESRNVNL
ncbi:unnamed protein product [Brachionus calyciflorus]|uniref:Uncharacterized protein n=1 Tax=Brachionus calyciflorus TaxID=104777 RepID=A0A813YQS6_9BILA|nr:unnamed protein product [Brachionus calyciflorus]